MQVVAMNTILRFRLDIAHFCYSLLFTSGITG